MQKRAQFQNIDIVYEPMSADAKPLRYDKDSVGLPKDVPPFIHYHNRIEIGICTSGLGIFYGNAFAESVQKGDIVLFLPGRAHYSRSIDEKGCMCRFAYLDAKTLLFNIFGETGYTAEILKDVSNYELPAVIRKKEHPHIHRMLKVLLDDLFAQNSQNPELLCSLQLSEFLLKIPIYFEKSKKIQDFAMPHPKNPISLVEAFISSHYYENITTENLCDICFLSESQLRRRFKAMYGASPMQYLKKLRCTIAIKLLVQTDLSIAEVSDRVGYADVSVFYRHFVALQGVSPTEYRKTSAK